VLVALALPTGLGVNEMAALQIKDVDLKRGCLSLVRLNRKKRTKETLALGKDIAQHLKDYIAWTQRKKGPLFLGHASPATTANMYANISFEDMQNGVTGLYQ